MIGVLNPMMLMTPRSRKPGGWRQTVSKGRVCDYLSSVLLGVILNTGIATADNLTLNCANPDNGFSTTFLFDESQSVMIHKTSYNPATKQKYTPDKVHQTQYFNFPFMVTSTLNEQSMTVNFFLFDLETGRYSQSGHYLSFSRVPNAQLFDCVMY